MERAGRSAEAVSFRIRSLHAEQRGDGDAAQAAIEVLMGRGRPSQAALDA